MGDAIGNVLLGNEEQRNRFDSQHGGMMSTENDPYLNVDTGQVGQNYSQSEYAPQGPGIPINSPGMGGGRIGGSQMGMAGLLMASGVPFDRAMQQAAGMMQQQQESAYKNAMRMQKMQQLQQEAQGQDELLNSLMGNDSTAVQGGGNSQADTLAQMNAGGDASGATDPSSPSNIYSQMDDPNAVPSPTSFMGAPISGSGRGGVDEKTKNIARLMMKSGDKKGAIKLLMNAQNSVLPGGFVKDPMMGPSRGGQGGTYENPQTGKVISSNTSKNTTTDQATIGALQRVKPQVERLMEVLPQFQQKKTQGKSYVQGLSNEYLGTNYSLPSEKAEAASILEAAPESLLKAYGLNVTIESLKSMRDMIKPGDGESPAGYKNRLMRNLAEMEQFGEQAKLRLSDGIVIKDAKNGLSNASSTTQSNHSSAIPSQPSLIEMAMAEKARRNQFKLNR